MALAFSLLSFVTALVRAEQPSRIAALMPSANAAITARIRAELAAAGFELLVSEPRSWPPSREKIAENARRERAIAGLALIWNERTIEIWIVDRVTGKTVVRTLASKPGAQSDQEQMDLVAICTIETLRASLLEISVPRHTRGEVAAPSAVRALVRTEPSRFSLRVAGALVYGSAELPVAAELGLAGTVAVLPRLRLGLDTFLPLTTPALTGPEGRAELALSLAGAFIEASLTDPEAPAEVTLGGGAWLGLLTLRGAAEAGYAGSSPQIVTLVPHLDLGTRARISRRVAVLARVSGAFATPKANVRFAGRNVASWGQPLVLGATMVEVGLD
jgi:hypothetical protein